MRELQRACDAGMVDRNNRQFRQAAAVSAADTASQRHWAALRPNFGFASDNWMSNEEEGGGGEEEGGGGEERSSAWRTEAAP